MSRPWLAPPAQGRSPDPARPAPTASIPRGEDAVLGQVMLSFEGQALPAAIRSRLAGHPAAGVTLFRFLNHGSPGRVRELTDALQEAAAGRGPLLVAADQESGQLIAFAEGTTPFAGNMALGATGDADLAERVGRAIGLELRAMGINVNYAPVCDVATNPAHPALGIRAFADEPELVGRLATATVRGLQSAGVAATLKHFPGKGDVAVDTHHELAVVGHDRDRFERVELAPFREAIASGARLIMSGHFAAPGLTGSASLPATLSRSVMHDLVRKDLGFEGLTITDALDMGALAQGPLLILEVVAAIRAGVDLLLMLDPANREQLEAALVHAARRGLFDPLAVEESLGRIAAFRDWVVSFGQPTLDVVGCAEHRALARELAERALTLVRDDAGLLPLRPEADARIAAIMPMPKDLTPADTSSTVPPGLAAALRRRHPQVDEIVTGHPPTESDIRAIRARAAEYDVIILGTINAVHDPAQVALVQALHETGRPLVTVALRVPFDLLAYPLPGTHVCTYSILPGSLDALADALWGDISFTGRLPVSIDGRYRAGHRLER